MKNNHKNQTFVIRVTSDGHIFREPFNAADPLKQMQSAVGGYIECVPTITMEKMVGQRPNPEGLGLRLKEESSPC